MDWSIWGTKSILESIMERMNLQEVEPILMGLKAFGDMLKPAFFDLIAGDST
jgi:hypothetical protein